MVVKSDAPSAQTQGGAGYINAGPEQHRSASDPISKEANTRRKIIVLAQTAAVGVWQERKNFLASQNFLPPKVNQSVSP